MRIVHCADIHIGAEFSANRLRSRQRKAEILQGFLRVVDFCGREGVDAMLVAGDLFDNENVEKDTIARIKEAFAGIPGTDIYIAPGNHDALTPDSPYRSEGWSSNVTIFGGKPAVIERPDRGYRIWGCGFESVFVEDRLLMGARLPEDELVNIGILHGQLVGKSGKSRYNAITDGDIEKSGLDYLALGHVHKQTTIQRLGKTFYAYSGTIEGQGFDEDGVKGFYTGELSKKLLCGSEPMMEYVSLSGRRYYNLEIDVSDTQSRQELAERVYQGVLAACTENGKDGGHGGVFYKNRCEDNLYKITLTGNVEKERTIHVEDLCAQLAFRLYYVKIKDRTELVIDYDELAKQSSLKGMFTARMLENIRECTKRGDKKGAMLGKRALELGIRAFYGEVEIGEN